MAASANTYANATYYDPASDASASASSKSGKSGVGSDGYMDDMICGIARNEIGARLAKRTALQIKALSTGLPMVGEGVGVNPLFGIVLDDVVLAGGSKFVIPLLFFDEETLMCGDGMVPGSPVDGILTFQELTISMLKYVQGMTCAETRQLIVAGTEVGAGLATTGLAGAGVGIGTAFGAWPVGGEEESN